MYCCCTADGHSTWSAYSTLSAKQPPIDADAACDDEGVMYLDKPLQNPG